MPIGIKWIRETIGVVLSERLYSYSMDANEVVMVFISVTVGSLADATLIIGIINIRLESSFSSSSQINAMHLL